MRWGGRLVLLALLAYAGVRSGDGLPYWVDGDDATGDVLFGAVLTAPALVVTAALAAVVRGSAHPAMPWVALGLDAGATTWAAIVASLYTLADLWSAGNVGWGVGVYTFGAAGVLLVASWVFEDWLTARRARLK